MRINGARLDTRRPRRNLFFSESGGSVAPANTYATWNPADKSANITLSGSNLIATNSTSSSQSAARGTLSNSAGKWYWEAKFTGGTAGSNDVRCGIGTAAASTANYLGSGATGWGMGIEGGAQHNAVYTGVILTPFAPTDILQIAWDAGTGKLWFGRNNTWASGGDPAAGTGALYSDATGTIFPMMSTQLVSAVPGQVTLVPGPTLNFTPPTGFNSGFYNPS